MKNPLGFGSAGITGMSSYRQAKRLLDRAFEAGIRHFDTAPLYGQGFSEKIIGAFIRNKRDQVTITTKFGLGVTKEKSIPLSLALPLNYYRKKWRGGGAAAVGGEDTPGPMHKRTISLQEVKSSLENSLRRLGTGHIDYFFLHEGLPSFLEENAMEFLLDQKGKGVIGALGLATNSLHLRQLENKELTYWDVLQYEAPGLAEDGALQALFPEKTHFFHSCLKHLNKFHADGISEEAKAGFILAEQAKKIGQGKILFFTRRENMLLQNISSFDRYYPDNLKIQ